MALMEVDFFSQVLGLSSNAYVILPQGNQGVGVTGSSREGAYPVLWLLHGGSDDHTIWLRRTSVERYVSELGLAVVMPAVHLSGYNNMAHGGRYLDFCTEELPEIMSGFFPLSRKREDNFVCGLSMGGGGTLLMGFSKPEQYEAMGVFSSGKYNPNGPGAARMRNFGQRKSGKPSRNMATYGTEDRGAVQGDLRYDAFAMAEAALKAGKKLPRVYHAIGREDGGYDGALEMKKWFAERPELAYEFHDGPGAHTWAFWDEWIQKFLVWLDLKKQG